jgi:hypothetical protein
MRSQAQHWGAPDMGGNARHGGADVASLDHAGRLPRLRGPRKRASRALAFLA